MWRYLIDPIFQVVNTAGKPATGGYVEVYVHGIGDKYYCASDFNGTLHPFKIPLNSIGTNTILADDANSYDIYVYNRYGSLLLSRENVSPVGISDIEESLNQKKDKQQPVNFNGSAGKTVKKITQDENGVVNVEFEDIDTPAEAPNVEITSPNETLDIHSSTNPQTNTKTFTLDVKEKPLSLGWFTSDVMTYSNGSFTTNDFTLLQMGVENPQGDKITYSSETQKVSLDIGWYHTDARIEIDWNGTPENKIIYVGGNPIDLSYNHKETISAGSVRQYPVRVDAVISVGVSEDPPHGLSVKCLRMELYSIQQVMENIMQGLSEVHHDGSLTGHGTSESPLSVEVDDELDAVSENPVQNKVLYSVIGDVATLLENL